MKFGGIIITYLFLIYIKLCIFRLYCLTLRSNPEELVTKWTNRIAAENLD